MKKEIWLSEEELNNLLQGTMAWNEVVSRLNIPSETSVSEESFRIRRLGEPLEKLNRKSFTEESPSPEPVDIPQGSKKVVGLLVGVAILTFGLWFYFILIG